MGKTYTVRAKRWKKGWELHIEGLGVTQVKKLTDAEAVARDYIALDLDASPQSFDLELAPDVGEDLNKEMRAARNAIDALAAAQLDAAASSRAVARRLRNEGLTGREIAVALRISPQRVSQLLKEGRSG
ncbi:hypothetical protein [Thermomonospora umbrina]|uniref:Sigma-70-like protein n=1 Tax=Thermomonospora umbrina TaxID=111806 RepID=A0A3D9SW15_9ACTN|nr:hypothetical protein [Thermomonospora umbrina]REE96774.1 hypothetical protein DFJ69_2221 [Thermomonospora umbrina]